MKITVINGNTRHGSTWHCMDLILGELAKITEVERNEFYLPKGLAPIFATAASPAS